MHACPYSRVIVYKRLVAPLSYGKLFNDSLLHLQFISYLRWTSSITRPRADRRSGPSRGQRGSRSQRAARPQGAAASERPRRPLRGPPRGSTSPPRAAQRPARPSPRRFWPGAPPQRGRPPRSARGGAHLPGPR